MGLVKKILKKSEIVGVTNYVGIELCETIHFHMPGFRFELTEEQFKDFHDVVSRGYEKWRNSGFEPCEEDKFVVLASKYLSGLPLYHSCVHNLPDGNTDV